jgi:hypothetical protein
MLLALVCCLLASCADRNPVGDPIDIIRERYTLPEQGASQWANDYIVALHAESGSYITYHPTQADFEWTYGPASADASADSIVAGDPRYVEPLLRFIDSLWISTLTPVGKQGNMLPYRILLVDSIWTWDRGFTVNIPAKVSGRSITFGGVNAGFANMTTEQKNAMTVAFTEAIWTKYYEANNMLPPFPDREFNAITDWEALKLAGGGFPGDEDKLQAGVMHKRNWQVIRPGIPPTYGWRFASWWTPYVGAPDPWTPTGPQFWQPMDKDNYLDLVANATDAEMQTYLDGYPKIRQKWNLILDWYRNDVGYDPRVMANANAAR